MKHPKYPDSNRYILIGDVVRVTRVGWGEATGEVCEISYNSNPHVEEIWISLHFQDSAFFASNEVFTPGHLIFVSRGK